MNQLLLGAAIGFVPFAVWYGLRRFRASPAMLIFAPLSMAGCALWAVVPDLPRLLGQPAMYGRWARDPRTDIFFWHYTIDRLETDSSLYHAALMLLGAALLAIAWRELRRAEEGS